MVKKVVYVVLGITHNGVKEVITIKIDRNESLKFWLSVFNNLKNRGIRELFVICANGLSGIKEAIEAAYSLAEYQRCIVHQIRNTLRHVSYKDYKAF